MISCPCKKRICRQLLSRRPRQATTQMGLAYISLFLALPAFVAGLSLSKMSFTLRRYVLAPLGLACPVELVYANKDMSKPCGAYSSLYALLKAKCPSLVGPKAFCKRKSDPAAGSG